MINIENAKVQIQIGPIEPFKTPSPPKPLTLPHMPSFLPIENLMMSTCVVNQIISFLTIAKFQKKLK